MDGAKEWEYEPPTGVDYIADCYTLNVADDACWACYYTEFPLIRIASDDSVAVWATPIHGARALAVGDGHAVFFGGYGDDHNRCVLLRFGAQELVEREALRLIAPSGAPFTANHVIGRGPLLHVFEGPRWYRLDVRRLPAD